MRRWQPSRVGGEGRSWAVPTYGPKSMALLALPEPWGSERDAVGLPEPWGSERDAVGLPEPWGSERDEGLGTGRSEDMSAEPCAMGG